MLYYYCVVGKFNKIVKITVTRSKKIVQEKKTYEENYIRQILSSDADLSGLRKLNPDEVKIIFSETSKGRGYLHALTFLIKSMSLDNFHEVFESQWKAFNAIYRSVTNVRTEYECLVYIRNHIKSHPDKYSLLIDKVKTLEAKEVRDKLRWNKMILNNFSALEHTTRLKNFLVNNKDHRLMYVFEEVLPVRADYLKQSGVYDEVVSHINQNKRKVVDEDLAATLCLNYAYFCRNMLVHAQNIEARFMIIIGNKSDVEIKWVSSLLLLMLIDLINANSSFD